MNSFKGNKRRFLKGLSLFTAILFSANQVSWTQDYYVPAPSSYEPEKGPEVQKVQGPSSAKAGEPSLVTTQEFMQNTLTLTPVEKEAAPLTEEIKEEPRQNPDYAHYSLDRALDLMRPEFASAVILEKPLDEEGFEALRAHSIKEGIEIAGLVLEGKTVLLTAGSGDEISASPAAREVLAKASFVFHTHPDELSREGPTGPDLEAAGDQVQYLLTKTQAYSFNKEGALEAGSIDWLTARYLAALKEAEALQNEKQAREELNRLIAEQDKLNQVSKDLWQTWLAGGTISYTSGLTTSSVTTLPGKPYPYYLTGSSAGTSLALNSDGRFKLGYDVRTSGTFSGMTVSFDNASTSAVETQNLSTFTYVTFGLVGNASSVKVRFVDVNGKTDLFTLTSVSSSTERFWRIKTSNIVSTVDKTRIKQINLYVDQSNTTSTTRTGTVYIRSYGLNTDAPTQPAVTSTVPQATNQTTLTLSGTKDANTSILVNNVEVIARNSSTTWSYTVSLSTEGNNTFNIQAKNSLGKLSTTKSLTVLRDTVVPTGSIDINSGVVYATSQTVTLNLSASDGSGSGVTQMSFSTDNTNWTTPETYAASKTFTLPSGDGNKTVYVKYFDKAGNVSLVYSKSITLDTVPPTGTLLINHDATYTNSTAVTLNLTGSDQTSGLDQMRFSQDGGLTWTAWENFAATKSLTLSPGDGTRTVQSQLKDKAGLVSNFSDTIILDTTPPQLTNFSLDEGATVDIPYLALSYDVVDANAQNSSGYQELDFQQGLNTLNIKVTDKAGNETQVWRHIYYVPKDLLTDTWQTLRNRYIQENAVYFQTGQGIDPATGFPLDVLGPNAPQNASFTQPTSIGFYLQFLGEIITKRLQVSFLSQTDAISQVNKVLTNLLQVQSNWGWKGLIPWLELQPALQPSGNSMGLIDNANLSHSLAAFAGALVRTNLHKTLTKDLYDKASSFLANQQSGYQSFVDSASGVFRASYNTQTQTFDGYADRFGSEVRATLPFLAAYFNLPSSIWDNLRRSTSRYLTEKGRVVETFSAFDGSGFQYFWPLLRSPEESLPEIGGLLQNALLIYEDFMDRTGIPGFASASSLPEGGYSGKIGIENLKETPLTLDESVGSVYSLASAYRLSPEFVLSELQKIETAFPALKGSLGFYDAARANGQVSQNYYAIDQGSLVLGLAGHGADDFRIWMQAKNLWQTYQDFYKTTGFDIPQAVQTLPEPPLTYEEIHNGHVDTGNIYSGSYLYNQMSGNEISVQKTSDGNFLYTPATSQGWIGGAVDPAIDLTKYSLVSLEIRNKISGPNQLSFEVKNSDTFLLNQTLSFNDNEWHTFQFFFPKLSPNSNYVGFTHATGAFEAKDLRFNDLPIFLGTFPPVIGLDSKSLTNQKNYLLQYEINGVGYQETVPLLEGDNTIHRIFHDSYTRQASYDFHVTLDTVPPDLQFISATETTNPNYTLVYTVDGVRKEEAVALDEGKNNLVRSATDPAGNTVTKTLEVILDSKPPVIQSFQINQGATTTKTPQVTLNLVAYDLGSQVTHMSFSNDGVNFTQAEPYSTSKAWTLADGKGDKTVWVKLKDTHGFWSDPVSAKIFYEKASVMDNFDGESLVQSYWDIDGTQVYQRSIVNSDAFEGTHAMRVDFKKTDALRYSFFALAPKQDGVANDFSPFRTLRLELKKLHDAPMVLLAKLEFNGTSETYETQVGFPQGTVGWQEAIFNFSSVSPDRLKNIRDILFFVDPGHPSSQGSFLIDNLVLDERPPSKLVDDFEGNGSLVDSYWDWDGSLIYRRSMVEQSPYDGTHSMKVEFTKKPGYPYSFFALKPKQDGVNNNFSSYGSLRFHLNKASDNPMVILMKLEFNGTDQTYETQLSFPQGSGKWQEALFDFSSVSASLLASVKNVLFFVDPASETTTGAFYLDHIRLAERPSVRLMDDFEGNSQLIDTYWDGDGAGVVYTRTIDNTTGADGTHSMKIDYHKTVPYPTAYFAFQPKQDGFANDFSRFNVLKLQIKKDTVPAMKLMMKFELDGTQINFESWKEIPQGTTGWTELAFDFSSLDPAILKKVRAVLFFVDPMFFSTPQETQGTFHLDSIRLGFDSDLPAKQFDPATPPQIGWVSASVANDFDNEYHVGSLVRINAWELNAAGDLLDGTVRIVSKSTGYDSGEQKLIFLHDGQFWPFHWDTRGLQAADDYGVIVSLKDKSGNVTTVGSETQPALTIKLTKGIPAGGELLRIQDFSVPSTQGPLPVSRSYDPTDADVFDHQLGLGWHSSFDYFVQDFPDGTTSLSLGAEGYQFFFHNPDGSYRPMAPDNYSTLVKLAKGFELHLKDGTLYEFTSSPFVDLNTKITTTWFVTRIVDRNQNETRFFYDENRNLTQVVSPSGDTIQLAYSFRTKDQFNTNKYNLDRLIGPSGNVWSFEHDVKGNLISTTDPLGQKTAYQYDDRSRLTKITYPDGSTQGYVYDSEGRVTQVLRNGVLQSEFIYGDRNDPVFSVKDALGRTSSSLVSPEGLLLETTDPLGNKTSFSYDEKRNLTKKIDPQGNVFTFTYDDKGNLLQSVDPVGGVTQLTYEPTFNLVTSITDALGNKTESSYDLKGNLILSKDPAGNTSQFTYDSSGNRLTSKDPLGNVTASTYDSRGLPLSVTDALGNQASYQYDLRGNVTKVTDPQGGVTQFEYDALNRLLSQTDALGRKTTYSYDSMGRRVSQIDALGNVTTFGYDLKGQPISQTDALGNKTSFAYDAKGNLISQTDALGNVVLFTYDELDRLIQRKDPLGRVTSFAYDSLGRRLSQTDALGNVTRFEYDSLGRLTKTTFPNGAVQTATYDLLGRVLSRTDALGNTTRFAYDSRGNLISTTDALGSVTSFQYDARNQRTSQTDALGNTTGFSYDALGRLVSTVYADGASESRSYDALNRLVKITDPLGRATSFVYDAVGNLIQTVDPAGNVATSQYDALNRKVREIDPLGNATNYAYDALGRTTAIVDAKGNTTSLSYDALGRLLQRVYPDGSKESFVYDVVGNLTQSNDRMTRATQFTYDALNHLTQRLFADSSTESFTYDSLGNVLTAANSAGTIRNEYDLLGRLTKQVDVFGEILEYSYDALGNRKSLKAIMGNQTLSRNYSYDALGRLTQISDEKARVTTYSYDSRSRIAAKILPNGTKTEFTYDAASELTTLTYQTPSGTSFRSLQYTYDNRGLMTQKNDSFEGASTFAYDKLGELISITNPVIGLVTFALDALGNRTQVKTGSTPENYTANALNEYSTAGNKTFQYDLDGNLLSRLDTSTGLKTSYEYDVKNRLTKVSGAVPGGAAAGGTLPDSTTVSFTYDALGRRITKTVNSQTTRYLWDGAELLAELDSQGNLLRSYVHGPVVDEVLYQEDYTKNETLFFHQDNLMSTLALTDNQGIVKESYTYDPYGNLLTHPSVSSTHFLYTGRELDPETSLYYNRNRYYDPTLGRFISADPKGYSAGLNLYTYTRDNPLSFRDPEGLDVYWGGGGSRGKRGGLRGFFGVLLGIVAVAIAGPILGAIAGAIGGAIGGVVGGVIGAVGGAVAGASVGAAVGSLAATTAFAAGTAVVATATSNLVQGAPVFRGVGLAASVAAITAGAFKVASWVGSGIQKVFVPGSSPSIELYRTSSEVPTRSGGVSFGSRIQQSVRNNFFRPESERYAFGREGTPLPEGRGLAKLIEDFIPTMHKFAQIHDNTVGILKTAGVPDIIANFPTMPPAYVAGVVATGFNVAQDIIEGIGSVVNT